MKSFWLVLGLAVLALFQASCSSNKSPSGPSAPVNHNYPYSATIGSGGIGTSHYVSPAGIVVFRNAIFVADFNGNKILKYDLTGTFLAAYTGFASPYGIAYDSTGTLYVTNSGAATVIQTMDQNGNLFTPWGMAGTAPGQFSAATREIAVDSSDNVYVADRDNNRIQRCSNTGTGCVALGGTAPGSGEGQFNAPYGVSIDKNGDLWTADSGNNGIQEFDSSLNFLQAFGTAGTANGQFQFPTDVRMDLDGNLVVVDQGNARVQKVSSSGSFIQLIGSGWTLPSSTAFDSNNNLYVTDFSAPAVKVFTPN